MSQRTYLSIGDVLSLLREEFPDITISKIRFLESQGLVDPERSPSGYRKFYEHDVARLRWVLRAQRDQFLPLKVIRDRLAAAGNGAPPDDELTEVEPSRTRGPAHAAGAARDDDPSVPASPSTSSGASRRSAPRPEPAAPEPAAQLVPPAPEPERATPEPERAAPEPEEAAPEPEEAAPEARAIPAAVPPRSPATPSVPGHAPLGAPAAAGAGPGPAGVSLTLAELCASTGLAPQSVAALERLGLISTTTVAGSQYYGEEALTVAKLAAAFARFGIEPRHLRLYRNAADREVGLVEQVVTPLLRQRNPEARRRAADAAEELTRLGQSLRSALVRSALRRQIGT